MGKLLFWIAVILVVLFVVRLINHQKSRAAKSADPASSNKNPSQPPGLGKAEEMVRCAHCGVYLPRSEALMKEGHLWCSQEHASLGAKER